MKLNFKIPETYHPVAKEYMNQIMKLLHSKNIVQREDFAAVILLGDLFNTYCQARDLLNRDGIILEEKESIIDPVLPGLEPAILTKIKGQKVHPALKVATDAQNQITKLLIEFNLTPRSRKKIELDLPVIEENVSPIDKFIKAELR